MSAATYQRCRSVFKEACTGRPSLSREAHTYSRQDRGLYGNTHKQYGNSVSESHRKSQRVWLPNVHAHSIWSRTLGRVISLRMTASVWRTINNAKYGGNLDAYLTSDSKGVQRGLGARGEQLRNEIMNKQDNKSLEKAIRAAIKSSTKDSQDSTHRVDESATKLESETVVSKDAKDAANMEGAATGM